MSIYWGGKDFQRAFWALLWFYFHLLCSYGQTISFTLLFLLFKMSLIIHMYCILMLEAKGTVIKCIRDLPMGLKQIFLH